QRVAAAKLAALRSDHRHLLRYTGQCRCRYLGDQGDSHRRQ
ncbi:hypothetical protein PEC301889_25820, partial [Pectobacterium carotovorum subsp. carotovorum]